SNRLSLAEEQLQIVQTEHGQLEALQARLQQESRERSALRWKRSRSAHRLVWMRRCMGLADKVERNLQRYCDRLEALLVYYSNGRETRDTVRQSLERPEIEVAPRRRDS
ncbi:MAG: hypothetical protein R3E96_05755, partial [Planctomycetota bacterium]